MTDPSRIVNDIEKEYKQLEENNEWNQVYQRIRSEGTYNFPCTAAKSAINKNLNRYRDVLPYDHTRIVISGTNTNFINASLVKVESVNRSYILTQGPLPQTSPHFWLMVWQQKVKGIIMLNKIIEKNQIKCHQYWPIGNGEGGEDTLEIASIGLRVELLNVDHHSHYNYTTLRLTEMSSGNSRTILHFHYTTWPDFGVPQSPEAFYKFLNVVRASGVLERDVGPSVVHCSAGIGRSGTFCLVDTVLMMDPCEESSSEEPSLIDDLPPQPPPRTDSLTRSMIESQLAEELDREGSDTALENDKDINNLSSEDDSLPPLPAEPPSQDSSGPDSSPPMSPNNTNSVCKDTELRRRKRRERNEATAAKVKEMVEKQQASEIWKARKRTRDDDDEDQKPAKRYCPSM